ncbi:TetR/AcrR family transcriptional regulator [Janthinobacterium sp. PC23-8]|uniref:TetR/AcrR family transcriptional regulator n=1 Tax=Janthinobacterium sp. PC23-8 TaxID=2012679 RepID=UPI000B9720AB|nr:hypothetical protein [Janthinobacterium sp. PC23-8]OYO27661.1 hypothetical protein CD932_21155 [Janthinobacterium sp. PC23-8]
MSTRLYSFIPVAPTMRGNEKVAAIVTEARNLLLQNGVSHFSLRSVATALNIRLFNIQHYFPTTQSLQYAALEQAVASFDAELAAFLSTQSMASAEAAFRECCRYYLRMNARRSVRFFFFELASVAQRDPVIEEMLRQLYQEYFSRIRTVLQSVNGALSPAQLDERVELIAAQLEGTMLVLKADDEAVDGHCASEERRLDFILAIATGRSWQN